MKFTEEERKNAFWAKVDKTDNCWLWTGNKSRVYGAFGINGKMIKAHRISWEMSNGPIPEGLCVLHKCDVPLCVNPGHLFLGTFGDNNRDREEKGRGVRMTGEMHGNSKLTWEKVREIREISNMSQLAIAAKYGVTPQCIANVLFNRTWRTA
jgi:hypothetical protein